ncbi:inositol monophosphatase family protein [uncultured Jatrophihabitans sp.]|uniref:inositol monophosphatase family protein n=1 Tax=uncultured Jatrophihabitans sp. TaxID=1610747 RepID=UPI0035C9FE25
MESPAASAAELGDLCRELALGAAALVRAARRDGIAVDAKSTATDLVTDVDRASERWLSEELARRRPGDAILAEEGGALGAPGVRGGTRWLLDPIDGTVNFVLGIPHYAVSVAVEVDGAVVAGAVANPASGETFTAVSGSGAYLDGVRLGARRDVSLARAVLGTGFGYDAALRRRQVAVVAPLLPQVGDIRRLGSAALDLCFLAAGRLDGYFEAGLHEWDHAAGGLIAVEAGCAISGLRGRPPSGRLYAAAAPALAGELFAVLAALGADDVGA